MKLGAVLTSYPVTANDFVGLNEFASYAAQAMDRQYPPQKPALRQK